MAGVTSHLVLLGPMGSGKSTVGRALAAVQGVPFVDSDDMVERRTGATAADVAVRNGVEELHRIEREVLLGALDAREPTVIAAAASVVDDPLTRSRLGSHRCVAVIAAPEVRSERTRGDPGRRPIDPVERVLLDGGRVQHLEALCFVTVDAGAATVDDCVATILAAAGPLAPRGGSGHVT